jgi:GTP-binding protein
VLTKSDKLNNQEKALALRTVKAEFADDAMITVQLFSSLKKQGVDEVEKVVGSWFAAATELQYPVEPTGGDSIS